MNAAEGIRIGASAAANAAIPLRSVPEIPHDASEPTSTPSNGARSEMPTCAGILEALGLTVQTPGPHIATPSEPLRPPVGDSAEASEKRAHPKHAGSEDAGDSKALHPSPRLIRDSP